MIPTLGKGGAEDIIISMANNFCKKYEVTIFILRREEDDKYNISRLSKRVNIISLSEYYDSDKPLSGLLAAYSAIKIFFSKKFYDFDIIHTNLTLSSLLATCYQVISIIPFYSKPKYIETFHTNFHLIDWKRLAIFIIGWNLRHRLVYEINKNEIKNLNKVILNRKKIIFIPFSADAHKQDASYKIKIHKRYKYSLMTVSRMRLFEKKISTMIDTLNILINKFNASFELILAGDGKDMKKIKDKVSKLGLSDNVKFLGYVDNPAEVIDECDFYMCAMVGDDPGISGIQACQRKKPLIGIQTLSGFTSSPIKSSSSADEIAKMIFRLSENENNYQKYAKLCKNHAEKEFSVSKMINSYTLLYKEILC